jgi:hypothetical protein
VEEGRRSTRATPDTLVDAASGVRWLIGEYTQELTVAYREAAAELLLAGARERSALVEAVFTGGIPDRDTLWEAAKLLRCPGKESSSWWPSRRPGSPRRGSRTPRRSWPGGGSARPGSCTPTSRWAWCPCGTPTRSPSCSSCCGAGSGPAAGSARPTLPSATPRAPSTTPAWCWPACPPASRRWPSSRRRRSACSPRPPRTRPGRWCARCWTGARPARPGACQPAGHPAGVVRRRWFGGRDRQADLRAPEHRPVPAAAAAGAHGTVPRRSQGRGRAAGRPGRPAARRAGPHLQRVRRAVGAGGGPARRPRRRPRRPGRPAAEHPGVSGAVLRGAAGRGGGGPDEPAAEGARGRVLPGRQRRQVVFAWQAAGPRGPS